MSWHMMSVYSNNDKSLSTGQLQTLKINNDMYISYNTRVN